MKSRPTFSFSTALFAATLLAVGCSQGGGQGCSGSGESGESTAPSGESVERVETATKEPPTIDSKLPGVYKITRFQSSQNGCDELADPPERLDYVVVYPFHPRSKPDETRLGGAFCGDPANCQGLGRGAPEPAVGYSFVEGDDASGWQGWAIVGARGGDDDRCHADVQSHLLSATAGNAIQIETKTVETVFDPATAEGGDVICRNRDAIDAVKENLPCKALLVLEATREAEL